MARILVFLDPQDSMGGAAIGLDLASEMLRLLAETGHEIIVATTEQQPRPPHLSSPRIEWLTPFRKFRWWESANLLQLLMRRRPDWLQVLVLSNWPRGHLFEAMAAVAAGFGFRLGVTLVEPATPGSRSAQLAKEADSLITWREVPAIDTRGPIFKLPMIQLDLRPGPSLELQLVTRPGPRLWLPLRRAADVHSLLENWPKSVESDPRQRLRTIVQLESSQPNELRDLRLAIAQHGLLDEVVPVAMPANLTTWRALAAACDGLWLAHRLGSEMPADLVAMSLSEAYLRLEKPLVTRRTGAIQRPWDLAKLSPSDWPQVAPQGNASTQVDDIANILSRAHW